ncbi:hypothetical protein EYC80_001403 [Monilinia laxa]|uniref:Uncharacterized protein n=1 Tax=Monilinia laxa TaxID=61186 RepID=A0A5N6KA49_MONLA|nr:hypothetical protein EYC80_001403 [Monilinia laxa]
MNTTVYQTFTKGSDLDGSAAMLFIYQENQNLPSSETPLGFQNLHFKPVNSDQNNNNNDNFDTTFLRQYRSIINKMDRVKPIFQKGNAMLQKGKERESFQNNDEVEHSVVDTGAAKDWEEFLKSAYYGTIVPAEYLEVDKHQDDPNFCIETFVHPLEKETRCALLLKQFNAYKGNTENNLLDEVYRTLAHDTMETEVWRGILTFRPFDATHINAVDQLQKVGFSPTDIAATSWHPVFGPKFTTANTREDIPGGAGSSAGSARETFHVMVSERMQARQFHSEGSSGRYTSAPSFESSVPSDGEGVDGFVFGDFNFSNEGLANGFPVNPPPSRASFASSLSEVPRSASVLSIARSASIITNCPALINHGHECTPPSDVLPASPSHPLIPAPPATGIEYAGPSPSAFLDQRLEDHVSAPVLREEMDVENDRQEECNREYRLILLAILVVFVGGSVAAIVAAIVVASKRKCVGDCF